MDADVGHPAEQVVRLLASAVGAVRLYPPTSALRKQAMDVFTFTANKLAASGPLRLTVEPKGLSEGGLPLAQGQGQVAALAEALYALQVGQLVIAPGVTREETEAFVGMVTADTAAVRAAGGPRSVLAAAGVRHMAVIELTLRASDDSGLLGMDLNSAPLDDIATELKGAAEHHLETINEPPQQDDVAEAIDRLDEATREIALERVASAMLRMDEASRMRVMALALQADATGRRMQGMLDVIARMKPAALARLLKLVATQAQTDPRRIASAIALPPETARALALLLAPTPDVAPDFGIPDRAQAAQLAEVMKVEEDTTDLRRQIKDAAPARSAQRALATATAVSRHRVDQGTVQAIGEVLPQAARMGAFATVREALRRLDEIALEPSMMDAVAAARDQLAEPSVLRDLCLAPSSDADAAIAGEILRGAGAAGAEALLQCYMAVDEPRRSLLKPVLQTSSELILTVARTALKAAEPKAAVSMIHTLAALGDRRAAVVLAETLDSSLDETVRFAAVNALVRMPVAESRQALLKAVGHRQIETQRHAVRELGRSKAGWAVPVLARMFDDVNVLARGYEVRKDIISALSSIGTTEAHKALRRFAARPAFGRKSRELKRQASEAVKMMKR